MTLCYKENEHFFSSNVIVNVKAKHYKKNTSRICRSVSHFAKDIVKDVSKEKKKKEKNQIPRRQFFFS